MNEDTQEGDTQGDALSNSLQKISFETEINLQDKALSSLKGVKKDVR